jgi:acyl-CoA synthetase (NDP forming)
VSGRRDLDALFAPDGVLLVGASANTLKWGGWVARSLAPLADRRRTYFVSRSGGELYGIPVHTSIPAVGDRVDLAIITIPAAGVAEAVDQALELGARALVVISAGFGEVGGDGVVAQADLVRRVREAGAVMLGPNCLGLFDAEHDLNVYGGAFPKGDVGLASQSGNLALEIALGLEAAGLGLSRFASVGNQADLTLADMILDLAYHDATRVVAGYVEAPADGARFAAALREASARKPVVLLHAGRSDLARRAALSHTGVLAAEARVIRAVARDAGVVVVETPGQLVDAVTALRAAVRPRRGAIAILADGGGHGVVASDVAADVELELAVLSDRTAAELARFLRYDTPRNPVDLAGAGEDDIWNFDRLVGALLEAPEVDAVVLSGFFGGYGDYNPQAADVEVAVARSIAARVRAAGKPLIVHSMLAIGGGETTTLRALREEGIPVYARIEEALAAYARATAEATPIRAPIALADLPEIGGSPAYPEARALLHACGVPFPAGALARTDTEAGEIAASLVGPLVLKAVAPSLIHKTDAGGVEVGVAATDVIRAAARMRERVADALPSVDLDGIWVEEMAPSGGIDLVVGARRDPLFGVVVLVGVGGIFVEVLDDVIIAPAPVAPDHLERLARGLRAAPLLAGIRGAPPVDVGRAVEIAARLGDLLLQEPAIAEVEINPLRVDRDGVLALDARVIVHDSSGADRTTKE